MERLVTLVDRALPVETVFEHSKQLVSEQAVYKVCPEVR